MSQALREREEAVNGAGAGRSPGRVVRSLGNDNPAAGDSDPNLPSGRPDVGHPAIRPDVRNPRPTGKKEPRAGRGGETMLAKRDNEIPVRAAVIGPAATAGRTEGVEEAGELAPLPVPECRFGMKLVPHPHC
jgi:hypothetical protein